MRSLKTNVGLYDPAVVILAAGFGAAMYVYNYLHLSVINITGHYSLHGGHVRMPEGWLHAGMVALQKNYCGKRKSDIAAALDVFTTEKS